MSDHGHVFPRPDGVKARCGGPALCAECKQDLVAKNVQEQRPSKQRWIPISEDHPDNGRSVLVVTSFHQMMVASWTTRDGFQYDHEDHVTTDRITHWRELPEYP